MLGLGLGLAEYVRSLDAPPASPTCKAWEGLQCRRLGGSLANRR